MQAYLKFRLHRSQRLWMRRFKRFQVRTGEYTQQHLYGKWNQLRIIRRFVIGWWSLALLSLILTVIQINSLKSYYLVPGSASGGVFVEGLVGAIRNINPILPEGEASQDVAELIFSGLTKVNPDRKIEADLAESWSVSEDGKTYTFKLRQDVKWHDGVPFTARDVRFTLAAIQNPDTRSPLANSWQGVTVEAPDDHTVVFKLPNVYAPFLNSTTFGILPSHKLESLDPSTLRVAEFNQRPIGTGPFKIKAFLPAKNEVQLERNENYYDERPLLDSFIFRLYENIDEALQAYSKREINGLGHLDPERIKSDEENYIRTQDLDLPNEVVVFLKTTSPVLSDVKVRRALAASVDRKKLMELTGATMPLELPLLPGQVGYTTKNQPPDFDVAKAQSELDAAGWKLDGQVRKKGQEELKIKLVTSTMGDYPELARALQQAWSKIGVKVDVITVDNRELQQSHIRPRNFDALLYGISLDADPDVYPYWHSSQKDDPGLNLSQYNSSKADRNLEAGRLTLNEEIRAAKYAGFLEAWTADVPAIVLYQPSFIYGVSPEVLGIQARKLVRPSDRFYEVEKWSVNSQPVQRQAAMPERR